MLPRGELWPTNNCMAGLCQMEGPCASRILTKRKGTHSFDVEALGSKWNHCVGKRRRCASKLRTATWAQAERASSLGRRGTTMGIVTDTKRRAKPCLAENT